MESKRLYITLKNKNKIEKIVYYLVSLGLEVKSASATTTNTFIVEKEGFLGSLFFVDINIPDKIIENFKKDLAAKNEIYYCNSFIVRLHGKLQGFMEQNNIQYYSMILHDSPNCNVAWSAGNINCKAKRTDKKYRKENEKVEQ